MIKNIIFHLICHLFIFKFEFTSAQSRAAVGGVRK